MANLIGQLFLTSLLLTLLGASGQWREGLKESRNWRVLLETDPEQTLAAFCNLPPPTKGCQIEILWRQAGSWQSPCGQVFRARAARYWRIKWQCPQYESFPALQPKLSVDLKR